MATIRELTSDETVLAYDALLELRPELGSREELVTRVDEVQRPEGYRLVASFDEGAEVAAAVAGFRIGHKMAITSFHFARSVRSS